MGRNIQVALISAISGILTGLLSVALRAYNITPQAVAGVLFAGGLTIAALLANAFGLANIPVRSRAFVSFAGLLFIGYLVAGIVVLLTARVLETFHVDYLQWDALQSHTPPLLVAGSVVGAIFGSAWATGALRIIRGRWEWDVFLLLALSLTIVVVAPWDRNISADTSFEVLLVLGQGVSGAVLGYGMAKPLRDDVR